LIGKAEPAWQAKAYSNGEELELGAEDYSGQWHVIYFYPLDFTFVCPTEIRGFEALHQRFEDENVSIIGASTDSYYSHRTWFNDRSTFLDPITHPILADTAHSVCRAFGVLHERLGVAYRATVIVDDQSIIRSIAINDLNAGRSPAEVLRVTQALKTGELCGADWRLGDQYAA
jgi:peroxiredoxin (alkyl hydroperoxide reductase subunit C)